MIDLTLCICTSGRVAELRRCLASIYEGTIQPLEVIVSNDCSDSLVETQVRAVCKNYDFVRYVIGPRMGLCANRNHVIQAAAGAWVSLLDDDATVGCDFVEIAAKLIASTSPGVVLTGDVLEHGESVVRPTNPTFLGHFGRVPRSGEILRNVQLNCNVFPRSAFENVRFDEKIVYGYEDSEVCDQLVALGYQIHHYKSLLNSHFPPPRTLEQMRLTAAAAEQARVTVTLRRYLYRTRQPLRALAFAIVAPLHCAAADTSSGSSRVAQLTSALFGVRAGMRRAGISKR